MEASRTTRNIDPDDPLIATVTLHVGVTVSILEFEARIRVLAPCLLPSKQPNRTTPYYLPR